MEHILILRKILFSTKIIGEIKEYIKIIINRIVICYRIAILKIIKINNYK